ncbi:hypothetical protein [Terasakiella pusilla]|uniref:hypothetical protein n=1 Tax=Terasakiella pusilla TaxID=64973 RepID=UPI003AA92735
MSSLFSDFTNLFSIGKTISQNSNTDPNDVLNTKNALAQTGDYQVPDFGITDIPDMGMIDGLKKFQQKNSLKVDGVMKPGGPTESKIGETLAGQGVSTVDPLASNTSKPKPKPTKIDPLTGLPKIKMPKLKKPTNAMWGQTANQQNQNANPWFKSTKLQPVSDEAHAENARTMDGMLNYSENGFLPTLYADAVKNGGEKAIAEYANFLNQLSDRKKERVGGFEQEVMNKLPEDMKQAMIVYAEQKDVHNNSVPRDEQSSPQDNQGEEPSDQEEQEAKEETSVKRTEDTCLDQKIDFWIAEEEYQNAREAMKTVQGAIEDVKSEIEEMDNYSPDFPHPDCVDGKIRIELPLEIEEDTETSQRDGIKFEFNIKNPRWKMVHILACTGSKNGDLVFDRMQAISDLKEHLGELESVESDLDYELSRLKQSSDATLEILRRCKSEKGED